MIIYILKLEKNKIYVGKTNDLEKRLDEHKQGLGSSYAKKYKFIKLLNSINSTDEFEEDIQVKKMMKLYGIDNVRGGSYSNIYLTDSQKEILNKELNTSENVCYRCYRNGHFINDCYATTNKFGNIIKDNNNKNNEDNNNKKLLYCQYCKQIIKNYNLQNHLDNYCDKLPIYNNKNSFLGNLYNIGNRINKNINTPNCNKCKRQGHLAINCYAKTILDEKIFN